MDLLKVYKKILIIRAVENKLDELFNLFMGLGEKEIINLSYAYIENIDNLVVIDDDRYEESNYYREDEVEDDS